VFVVIGLSGVFFNGYVGVNEVHAQDTGAQNNGTLAENVTGSQGIDTMSLWQILNIVLKIIYLLLWPLLVVA